MSSLHSVGTKHRATFYPLSPSIYPQPTFESSPSYETSYGQEFCTKKNEDFFRSRTFSDDALNTTNKTSAPFRDIYPRHGSSTFTLPYYRRDSKGFRRPYTQPSHVDNNYMNVREYLRYETQQLTAQAQTNSSTASQSSYFSHPGASPNYRAQEDQVGGVRFGVSLRGSAHYAPRHTSDSVSESLLRNSKSQPLPTVDGFDPTLDLSQKKTGFFNDPLLEDPLQNAYRMPRTTYKRAYGKCQ